MKKVKLSDNENCITTPTSCVEWNGGSIEFLGICDGDSLNKLTWEVINKLEEIAGEDLSQFDIDSLLDICNQKAPLEVTIISILTLIKDNQICLKDFIDTLNERLNELFQNTGVNVDLKCYAQFDNLGNSLSITRDQLDQLIINTLCDHEGRLDTIEGKIITMQAEINAIDPTANVEELSFSTCVDPAIRPTSQQVMAVADAHCDLEAATGNSGDIATALAQTPTFPTEVTSDPNYIAAPANMAENYSNALIALGYLLGRVAELSECCEGGCDAVELGFTAVYSEDGADIIITWSWGAGTNIPPSFTDCGSTLTITDSNGVVYNYNLVIANNASESFSVVGLNTLQPLTVEVTSRMCSDTVTCQRCLTKNVSTAQCQFCTYTATGTTGSAVIVYTINEPAH